MWIKSGFTNKLKETRPRLILAPLFYSISVVVLPLTHLISRTYTPSPPPPLYSNIELPGGAKTHGHTAILVLMC